MMKYPQPGTDGPHHAGWGLASLLLLCLITPLQAEEQGQTAPATPEPETFGLFSVLNLPRNFLSDNFLLLSDRIDRLFSNTDSYEERNTSYARFSLSNVYEANKDPYTLPDSFIFVAMPRTQRKLTLLLQTESSTDVDSGNPDLLPGSPSQQTNALALRGDFFQGKNWKITSDLGTGFYNGTIDPFFRVTYTQKNQFERWSTLWREAFFRFGLRGNGVESRLRFDRGIGDKHHLRFDNLMTWYEQETFIDRSHSLALFRQLENKAALAYAIGSYRTKDPEDTIYYTQLRYKKLIHKTWLYYELVPEIIYPQSSNYTATPRFTLKFEIMLGNP